MIRLFLAVDGGREMGRGVRAHDSSPSWWDVCRVSEDGAAARLVQRVLERGGTTAADFEVCVEKFPRIHQSAEEAELSATETFRRGYRGKLAATWALAKTMKCGGVVVLVDTDRSEPRTRWGELNRCREEAVVAGESLARRTAIGEATRCFEAWILGTAESIHLALGGPPCAAPSAAEQESDPKSLVEQWLGLDGRQRSSVAHMYAEVCGRASISQLLTRCSMSFKPFADEVIGRLGPMFGVVGPTT